MPDRVIVLGLLTGAWWALFAGDLLDASCHRRDAGGLAGPDWDVRAEMTLHFGAGVTPLPAPYPRALRQAKGVGRRRSQDLTRYFQAYGRDAPPDGLYGIGQTTAAAVVRILEGIQPPISPGDDSELSDPP